VDGAIDGIQTAYWYLSSKLPLPWSIPAQATAGQLKDVVCNYLRDNPKYRASTASSLTIMALRDAFPCNAGAAP